MLKKVESRRSKVERKKSSRPSSLDARLKAVRLFLCDVDGVLTDAAVFVGGAREVKRFDIRDGLGLVFLQRAGIKTGWVSNRPSAATRRRARELNIDFLAEPEAGKVAAVEKILARTKSRWSEVCYLGDDVFDLGVLERAGVAVAVADAGREARAAAAFVTRAPGGHGAVREVAEMILQAQGKWDSIVGDCRE
jgi:3-deoxy-D-manno-octulosonate 8-phosphate phosphatase (KDO 8-P phosphatase)